MALILDCRSYLYFLSLIKKPIFLGSNLLFLEGSFKFIMDKEIRDRVTVFVLYNLRY